MKKCVLVILVLFFFVSTIAVTGCASLFKPKYGKVNFGSEPVGADVYINGYNRGKTPIQLKLSHKEPVTVTFKKDGYEDKTYVINTRVGAVWIILDCLGGFIPVIIDAATNNWSSLDSDNIQAILEVRR